MTDVRPRVARARAARSACQRSTRNEPVRAFIRPADFTLKENILGLAVLATCAAIVIGAIVLCGVAVLVVLITGSLVVYARLVFLGWMRLRDIYPSPNKDDRP